MSVAWVERGPRSVVHTPTALDRSNSAQSRDLCEEHASGQDKLSEAYLRWLQSFGGVLLQATKVCQRFRCDCAQRCDAIHLCESNTKRSSISAPVLVNISTGMEAKNRRETSLSVSYGRLHTFAGLQLVPCARVSSDHRTESISILAAVAMKLRNSSPPSVQVVADLKHSSQKRGGAFFLEGRKEDSILDGVDLAAQWSNHRPDETKSGATSECFQLARREEFAELDELENMRGCWRRRFHETSGGVSSKLTYKSD